MKYDRRDLPKIIALSVLLLGVMVYIGVSYAGLSRHYRAQQEAEERSHQLLHAAPAPDDAGRARAAAVAALVGPTPTPDRDPFHPLVAPRRAGAAPPTPAPQDTPTPEASEPRPVGPPEGLRVAGIIVGQPTVAVLRAGQDHYVVNEGDWLDRRLRVQRITATTVTLNDGDRAYLLRLGRGG